MLPDDPRHGTTRGHAAGCREQCCREARNVDERNRRKRRQVLGIQRRVDALGTTRRIRALWVMGWPSYAIAEHCGWPNQQSVSNLGQPSTAPKWVFVTTRDTIAAAYEALAMHHGPSKQTRTRALRRGYVPPLAWDDIDHDEHPRTEPRATRPGRPAVLPAILEDFDWLTSAGESPEKAAARVGVTLQTIDRYRLRQMERAS